MPRERREVCKECGRAKPALAIEQGDEFCSTGCARRHNRMGLGERTNRGTDALWESAEPNLARALVGSH